MFRKLNERVKNMSQEEFEAAFKKYVMYPTVIIFMLILSIKF